MPMIRWLFLIFLGACQTPAPDLALTDIKSKSAETGPAVNDLVKVDQEKWLNGQVKNPSKAQIKQLIVFGDSLSDTGRLHSESQGRFLPPTIYYKARLSNGPIWIDYASNALGWNVSNFAFAGAQSSKNDQWGGIAIPSLLQQIKDSKAELKKADFDSTLVVIWIGANNYLRSEHSLEDANLNPDSSKLEPLVQQTIEDLKEAIEKLQDIGFKNFILGNLPELSSLKRSAQGPALPSNNTLAAATSAHNATLAKLIAEESKQSAFSILAFHAFEISQKAELKPKEFGFNEQLSPCYQGSLSGEFYGDHHFCAEPKTARAWDAMHPSSKMHCYIAEQFLNDLQAAGKIEGFDAKKAESRCQAL